jgi:N-glycosylase/DNA lyase
MKYTQHGDKIIITEQDSFKIDEILECGQCFRFEKIDENKYEIVAHNKILNIVQQEGQIELFPMDISEFENTWINYFDLKTNYEEIKSFLSENDPVLKEAIKFASGIRILNQDSWECLVSFIISQNNRIPMIKKIIWNICEKYGEKIGDKYTFPSPNALIDIGIDELMLCKTGFRAKYIIDSVYKITNKVINIEDFINTPTKTLREELMTIKGVGPKVADCVLLFGCSRKEVFPIDVWVKRVMQHYYFEGNTVSIKDIHDYAEQNWGDKAGYAQQYLFHYARQQKIGK